MSDRCATCRFWCGDPPSMAEANKADEWGQCRFDPPRLVEAMVAGLMPRPAFVKQIDPDLDLIETAQASMWPATFANEWCGKYTPRREEVLV